VTAPAHGPARASTIPIVNIIISIVECFDLARVFGKGAGFGLGLVLLGSIFLMLLAWGDAQYQSPMATAAPARGGPRPGSEARLTAPPQLTPGAGATTRRRSQSVVPSLSKSPNAFSPSPSLPTH
jgi:hypothetical protein